MAAILPFENTPDNTVQRSKEYEYRNNFDFYVGNLLRGPGVYRKTLAKSSNMNLDFHFVSVFSLQGSTFCAPCFEV
jgi:hypothetical protein